MPTPSPAKAVQQRRPRAADDVPSPSSNRDTKRCNTGKGSKAAVQLNFGATEQEQKGLEQGQVQLRRSTRRRTLSSKAAAAAPKSQQQRDLDAVLDGDARRERWDKLKEEGCADLWVIMESDRLTAAVIGSDMKAAGLDSEFLFQAPPLDDGGVADTAAEAVERSLPTILRLAPRIKEMAEKKKRQKTPAQAVPAPAQGSQNKKEEDNTPAPPGPDSDQHDTPTRGAQQEPQPAQPVSLACPTLRAKARWGAFMTGPCENEACGCAKTWRWGRVEGKVVCHRCHLYHFKHQRFPDAPARAKWTGPKMTGPCQNEACTSATTSGSWNHVEGKVVCHRCYQRRRKENMR